MNINAFNNVVFRETGIHKKVILVMKITSFLLLVVLMQVSAAGLAQKINLNEKNVSLKTVIEKVRLQSGYNFLYIENVLDQTKPVNIQIQNVEFAYALKRIFSNQPLDYEIKGKTVVIRKKEPSMLSHIIESIRAEDIRGHILDENGKPLPNATIKIKGTNLSYTSNNNGEFFIKNVTKETVIQISYIGYKTKEVDALAASDELVIRMELLDTKLEEVNIVSTGYQTLPKERATGSFEKIDNKLFNRSTGTNVTSRLLGTVTGLYFNNRQAIVPRGGTGDAISIRGISSLATNANSLATKTLVVLDNIPYEGDLTNLNPNDVENITILKDAAAASIWGTRAGNGVIVITTKKGAYEKPLSISLNGNITIAKKPDLFYIPQISSSDAIEVERFLFMNKFFDNKIARTTPPLPFLTPVVELLAKQRSLPSTDITGRMLIDEQINALRKYDIRNDYLRYMYRQAVNQQYALNLNGGNKQMSYLVSAGYDRNLNSLITSDYDRTSLRSNFTFKPIKQLDIQTGFLYTRAKTTDVVDVTYMQYNSGAFYPYARLADDNGNPLAPGMTYRAAYLDSLSKNSNLLDWRFKPLEDLHQSSYRGYSQDILFNLGLTYTFNSIFSADIKYQYERTNSDSKSLYYQDSYYARNLINFYTDPVTFNRAIPLGAINNPRESQFNAQTIRGQINANKEWNNKHELTAIAGAEARKNYGLTTVLSTLYGFDPKTNAFLSVDTKNPARRFFGGTALIPNQPSIDDNNNRFTSLFANVAYTYNSRYSISTSIRKDASNIFGDNANKQGSPLWSAGLSWDISKENVLKSELFPYLKLRATYGYSGNVATGVPAYAVVTYPGNDPLTGLPYAETTNPPNPDLRWEKVGMLNVGLDFSVKNNRLTGNFEYFDKRSKDLVVSTPADLTKGIYDQSLNSASIHGKGIDLTLNSLNLNTRNFQWRTTLIFSYTRSIVTRYLLKESIASTYVGRSNGINPIEGRDAYAVLALKWAGLDPATGEPQGYLNGVVSKDYDNLLNSKLEDIQFFGSSIPVYHGALRNTFSYKGLELSANILYKFNYYFKRQGINYSGLYNTGMGNAEFARRWQKPGDERTTDVPAMLYPPNSSRDQFYEYSAATVEKGDHIRLQDITAAYLLPHKIQGVKSVRLYANMNNVGILWRANNKGIDPDIISGYPFPRTFSIGLNANF